MLTMTYICSAVACSELSFTCCDASHLFNVISFLPHSLSLTLIVSMEYIVLYRFLSFQTGMANERVDKYFSDMEIYISKGSTSKIISEVKHLSRWLQKHQNETLTDNSQARLIAMIERYFIYSQSHGEVLDCLQSLVADYLTLPEGEFLRLLSLAHIHNCAQHLMNETNYLCV